MTDKKRDVYVDALRGFAMLIVVLGHTLSGSVNHSEESILYNIIWSLQMPLFILISGYVTRYGKNPGTASGLFRLLLRRTLAYLLPWVVFTIIINGLIIQKQELSLNALFWHLDSGYWFLITLWCINLAFVIARFLAFRIKCNPKLRLFLVSAFYLCFMAAYDLIGMACGMSFLCIRLTLYYMPFYFLGYLFGVYKDALFDRFPRLPRAAVAVCTVIWVIAIIRLQLFYLEDTVPMILLRAFVSLCGCIAVSGLFKAISSFRVVYRFICWIGSHSVEVYLLHYYLLNLVVLSAAPDFLTAKGWLLIAVNYALTVLLVSLTAKLLGESPYLSFALFGRPLKQK